MCAGMHGTQDPGTEGTRPTRKQGDPWKPQAHQKQPKHAKKHQSKPQNSEAGVTLATSETEKERERETKTKICLGGS